VTQRRFAPPLGLSVDIYQKKMARDVDYLSIFRIMSDAELLAAINRLREEFADPYTQLGSAGNESRRDRALIARELSAASQVFSERQSRTRITRTVASFS
jgi:hypothetical protein